MFSVSSYPIGVIPAEEPESTVWIPAGVYPAIWIPAFAGMTPEEEVVNTKI